MLKTDEKHFNELELKVRGIASTWILAGFGAIAYLINTNEPALDFFSTYTMINLVCLMIVIGLFILWILDQVVYQRLLNANFVAGLYYEYKQPSVPPIRHLMVIGSEFKGMTHKYNLYYFIPMLVFSIFSTVASILEFLSADSKLGELRASVILGLLVLVLIAMIWRFIFNAKRNTPFQYLITAFGDPEFESVFDPAICRRIVQRWQPQAPDAEDPKEGRE